MSQNKKCWNKAVLVLIPFWMLSASTPYVPHEVIVVCKKNSEIAKKFAESKEIKVVKTFTHLSRRSGRNYLLLRSPQKSTHELTQELLNDPDVLEVRPNYYRYLRSLLPDDPNFDQQWALLNHGQSVNGYSGTPDADIDAEEAWENSTGSGDVVVAVIDSGINYRHEDLRENMWINYDELNGQDNVDDDNNGCIDDIYGCDFTDEGSDPMDRDGHGTMVAGVIGARGDNGKGISGVAWDVSLMALKVVDSEGRINNGYLYSAFEYILEMKERGVNIAVVNASYSGEDFDQEEKDYIELLKEKGILLVAAAGNEGKNIDPDHNPEYPASYDCDNIIAVAATDQDDHLPVDYETDRIWTNYGQISVDLAAPGVNLLTTDKDGGYVYFSGTSAATPMVTGAVAVLASAYPDESYSLLRARILDNTDHRNALEGYVSTEGRLNLYKALELSLDNLPPIAFDDYAETPINQPVTISVLENDEDDDGDSLQIESVSSAGHGDVEILSDGTIRYTPEYGFKGEDRFTYSVTDGHNHSAGASVTVQVYEEKKSSGGGGPFNPLAAMFLLAAFVLSGLRHLPSPRGSR